MPPVIPYTGYGSTTWIRVLGRVLLDRRDVEQKRRAGRRPRLAQLHQRPVADAEVRVDVGGEQHAIRADRSGIIDAVVDGRPRARLARDRPELGGLGAGQRPGLCRRPATRFGVVSDIDDTVMVTALPRPLLAAWHTFVVNEHARATTPGMPVLYERLITRHPGAPVIYLSTGAWNVAPTLTRFLSRNLYPAGALLLTDWGPTADRWFRSGREHKRDAWSGWPGVPATSAGCWSATTASTTRRSTAPSCASTPRTSPPSASASSAPARPCWPGAGYATTTPPDGPPVPWLYAPDGAGLAEKLDDTGLLEPAAKQPEVEA